MIRAHRVRHWRLFLLLLVLLPLLLVAAILARPPHPRLERPLSGLESSAEEPGEP